MSTQTGLSTLQFMARYNTAIHSLESPDGKECIDVFRRPDATFGFEKYRRDVEDCRGWFPTEYFSGVVFNTAMEALLEAQKHVLWLNHVESLNHYRRTTTLTLLKLVIRGYFYWLAPRSMNDAKNFE